MTDNMTIAEISRKIDKIYISEKDWKKIIKWGQEKLVYDEGTPYEKKLTNKRMFFPLKTFVIDLHMDKNAEIPSYGEWEYILLDQGYILKEAHGINRFYVDSERNWV